MPKILRPAPVKATRPRKPPRAKPPPTPPPRPHYSTPMYVPPHVNQADIDTMLERIRALSLDGGPPQSLIPLPEDLESLSADELWLRMNGWTPLEFLSFVYRNPYLPMGQRIIASKALLEFVHKPRPHSLTGADGAPLVPGVVALGALGAVDPRKLSDTELDTLQALLDKARVKAS